MSLSQALSASVAGLNTTQSALSLVAANVANAQTPGYIRKTLVQTTTSAGDTGISVRAQAINRELDQFLQRQLRVETSGGSYADTRAQFYSRLQQIYGDPSSGGSLEATYNNFTSALQALSTSPKDISAQGAVLNAAQALTQQLNGMTNQIQGLRSDAEQGLADAVATANNAMTQIANINRQLSSANPNDASAATLADQRDAYIDQLSQMMDIKVVNGDNNQVTVFTNSGIQLVGISAAQLSFTPQGTVTASTQWNADPSKSELGTLTLVSSTGGRTDLIAGKSIRSGQIAAYLEMRDSVLVQAQSQLDGIASAISQMLSNQTAGGTPATAGPASGFKVDVTGLQPGNTINLTYTDQVTNQQHKVTIVRVDDPSALPLSNDATTDPNDEVVGIDFSGGLPSVVSQLNAKFTGKLTFSNPSGNELWILNDGTANSTNVDSASITTTATGLTGGSPQLPFFTDAAGPYTGAITSTGSESIGFAGRITVNAALLADPSKLTDFTGSTAAGDATRPNFLYQQLTQAASTFSPSTGIGVATAPFSGSVPTFIRQMLSQQGANASNATNLAQGQDVVVNALKQRFADQSGVNVDQEMANLVTLQNAYAANARVMSAVTQMFQTLMNIGS